MLSTILWGLRHRRLVIRIYTIACLIWLILLILAFSYYVASNLTLEGIIGALLGVILLGVPPLAVIMYLRRKTGKMKEKELELDPYLISAKEKIIAMEKYFKGETSVSWSPVVTLAHDALMATLQRMIIDVKGSKGIQVIEQLRREKKITLHTLSKLLKDMGVIDEDEMKNLEILRDIRNRIVHEDYHPSKEQALWALKFVKSFISKHYPNLKLK